MSFYPQPDYYKCGPFALKYSLVMLGILKNENEIAEIAGTTWWYGTDEIGLARAARKYKCSFKHFHSSNEEEALNKLINFLKRGFPCLLCVKNWEHWVAAINYENNKFVIVDSGQAKVFQIYSSKELLKFWKFIDTLKNHISFDGYALIPKFKPVFKAMFTVSRAKVLRLKRNEELAKNWDKYFENIIYICKRLGKKNDNYLAIKDFIKKYKNLIVEQVAYWKGDISKSELEKIFKNLCFVGDTYNLVIYEKDVKKAIVDFAILLTMYSYENYILEEI